jgi:hypothetical protein
MSGENKIVSFLRTIQAQILEVRDAVDLLAQARGKRRLPVQYLTVRDAGAMLGRSPKAIQSLLERDAQNPDGVHPRRIHGGIHAQDFQKFIESKHIIGRGQKVRRALEQRS